ncbi:unnamed protein product [Merluccius merluccius]
MQLTKTKPFKPPSKKMEGEEKRIGKKDQERVREGGRDRSLTNHSERKGGADDVASRLAMGASGAAVEKRTSRRGTQNRSLVSVEGFFMRAFNWLNENLKERHRRKIQRTHFRERTEGDELYVKGRRVFAASMIKSRAERERAKRQALQRQEKTRVKVEERVRSYWAAKRSEKEEEAHRRRVEEERRDDTEWRPEYDSCTTDFKDMDCDGLRRGPDSTDGRHSASDASASVNRAGIAPTVGVSLGLGLVLACRNWADHVISHSGRCCCVNLLCSSSSSLVCAARYVSIIGGRLRKRMFHIVEFILSEETKIVPASWVRDGMSYWPPYGSRERCNRAVMRAETPDNLWTSYDVRIRCTRAVIHEILTKLETIEKHQLLILMHLQKRSSTDQPTEAPDVVDLPLPITSQGQLCRVEEAVAQQPDLKRKLVLQSLT